MTSPMSETNGTCRPETPTDGDLIRACEHLLFETGATGVKSVDDAIVMVCHEMLNRIFPEGAENAEPMKITGLTPFPIKPACTSCGGTGMRGVHACSRCFPVTPRF